MTRKEIESMYQTYHGVITSPGKFENEPSYVPYFYDLYLNGMDDSSYIDDDDGIYYSEFDVNNDDLKEFPELEGAEKVIIWESEQGFINHILK